MAAEAVPLLLPVCHILQNDNKSNGEEVQGTDDPTEKELRGRGEGRGEQRLVNLMYIHMYAFMRM